MKVKKIIFATVDKSPHCLQMHYIENKIRKSKSLAEIENDEIINIKTSQNTQM